MIHDCLFLGKSCMLNCVCFKLTKIIQAYIHATPWNSLVLCIRSRTHSKFFKFFTKFCPFLVRFLVLFVCPTEYCLNGGTCEVDGINLQCQCPDGFGGNRCQTRKYPQINLLGRVQSDLFIFFQTLGDILISQGSSYLSQNLWQNSQQKKVSFCRY